MPDFTRREFLGISAKLAALMGLCPSFIPQIAAAVEKLAGGNAPVLWLQGQSCSGCSVSFLNSADPGPASILTQYISLLFHSTLSTATGHTAMEVLDRSIEKGGYFLVAEGSVPAKMPEACVMGEKPLTDLISRAARNSQAVITLGACASFGGIPAAENNPTGSVSVPAFLKQQGINKPIITLPGCPSHPDWLVGTLVQVLKFGMPPLDDKGRPLMFFSKLIHDQCPRFPDYEREKFARTFGEDGCLFKLGCLGPVTRADCTLRYWNDRVNTCIKAGGPCIGCASEEFAARTNMPFYLKK